LPTPVRYQAAASGERRSQELALFSCQYRVARRERAQSRYAVAHAEVLEQVGRVARLVRADGRPALPPRVARLGRLIRAVVSSRAAAAPCARTACKSAVAMRMRTVRRALVVREASPRATRFATACTARRSRSPWASSSPRAAARLAAPRRALRHHLAHATTLPPTRRATSRRRWTRSRSCRAGLWTRRHWTRRAPGTSRACQGFYAVAEGGATCGTSFVEIRRLHDD
jgi:hypothetical protein